MRIVHLRPAAALALPLLAPALASQDYFIASSGEPQLTRARDLDGSGVANDPGEFTKCVFDPTKILQGYEVRATALFGAPALLWLENDPTLRNLVALVDSNGNGVFDPSEIHVLANLTTLFGISSNTQDFFGSCVEASNGRVYVSDNMLAATPIATTGIYRVDSLTTIPTGAPAIRRTDIVPIHENYLGTNSGTTTQGGSFERLGWIPTTSTLLGYHTFDDCIYAMRDLDSDGAFTSPGELVNWLNAADHKPGIQKSADFFGGPLSAYGALFNSITAGPNNFGNRFTFHYLAFDPLSGAVYVGSRRGNNIAASAGKIFKCVDSNGNGTCNDPGEVTLYVDDMTSGQTFVDPATNAHYPPSAANGPNNYGFQGMTVDPSTGILYALSTVGPGSASSFEPIDIVWKLVDLDADGDANDPGEQIPVFFQRPAGSTSRGLEVVPAGTFAAPFAAASVHPAAGAQTPVQNGSCFLPASCGFRFYAGPPTLGNSAFQVSVSGMLPGGSFAQLWFSKADWDPVLTKQLWDLLNGPPYDTGLPYPNDLSTRNLDEWLPFGIWTSPSPMWLDILDLQSTGTFWLENFPGGSILGAGGVSGAPAYADPLSTKCGALSFLGRFDATIPIPNDPFLAGQTFRLQWHVDDPSTALSAPGQLRAVSDFGFLRIQ